MLIYGAVLVIIMVLRPEGIMGQYELGPRFFRMLKKRFTRGSSVKKEGETS